VITDAFQGHETKTVDFRPLEILLMGLMMSDVAMWYWSI
jgi:hypothetical protein